MEKLYGEVETYSLKQAKQREGEEEKRQKSQKYSQSQGHPN